MVEVVKPRFQGKMAREFSLRGRHASGLMAHDMHYPKTSDASRQRIRRCYLVSCVAKKRLEAARAKDLYVSDWFKKARAYIERSGDPWFILSAEYGLLDPEETASPYERTLNNMSIGERRSWARRVVEQMRERLPPCDEIHVLAGMRYREFIMEFLSKRAKQVRLPLEGLRIGEQLSWLGSHSPENG